MISSPLLRARETAAAIATAAGAELRVDERLAPGAGLDDVLAAVGRRRRRRSSPSATSPTAREIVDALGVTVDFPPAGHVEIEPVTAISVSGLRKSYDDVEAVRGIDFEVGAGEVFGLLGPNGAGKTTTVEILEGYRKRDAGDVRVLGFDPGKAERALRERIGVVLQQSELWPNLTVREIHRIFAGYYEQPRDVDEVIELVGLDGEGGRAGEDALGRPEAAARPRGRARRRPRARLPRRADDRLRPRRAPERLGARPLAARARQDGRC